MNSRKIDILVSDETDSFVNKVCEEKINSPTRIEMFKEIYMDDDVKIKCMLYKLNNYTSLILELVFEKISTEEKKVYSKSISEYTELYVPMIEEFHDIRYIINFRFDSIIKTFSDSDKLNKLFKIYDNLDESDVEKLINATDFKNIKEKLLLSLALLIYNKTITDKESISRFDYYGYFFNEDELLMPIWTTLIVEKRIDYFISPLMIFVHMCATGINIEEITKRDIINNTFSFYNKLY